MKLFLGFLCYGILTILIAFITLSSLQQLNDINNRIIRRDVPLVEITDKMAETLLAQELYGRRSLILRSPEMEALFSKRAEEFKRLFKEMRALPDTSNLPLDRLGALHEQYTRLFKTGLEKGELSSSQGFRNYDQQIRKKQEDLIALLRKISRDAREDQNQKSQMTLNIGHSAFLMTAGLTIGGLLLGIFIAFFITRSISRSINQLKLSTKEISEGKFDDLPRVRNRDELGDLFQAFQKMAQRLKSLEEMQLDANPLTRLPGGVAIENVLNNRLKEGKPLAFCQLDLSHFKAFNDRYGYARGNEVLRATARIVTDVAKAMGNEETFVGHIGGDDFVLITPFEGYKKICLAIIDSFDKMVPDFYDPEDRQRGCIDGETRQGEKVSFPIMSLTIAAVTNQHRKLESHLQVGEIAAELKSYAKSSSHSVLVVDRRVESGLGWED